MYYSNNSLLTRIPYWHIFPYNKERLINGIQFNRKQNLMEKILQAVIKAIVTELAKVIVKKLNDSLSGTYSKKVGK